MDLRLVVKKAIINPFCSVSDTNVLGNVFVKRRDINEDGVPNVSSQRENILTALSKGK